MTTATRSWSGILGQKFSSALDIERRKAHTCHMDRTDMLPMPAGTFHVTDDIVVYVNTDVPWLAYAPSGGVNGIPAAPAFLQHED